MLRIAFMESITDPDDDLFWVGGAWATMLAHVRGWPEGLMGVLIVGG
jgi:hypothetical protein